MHGVGNGQNYFLFYFVFTYCQGESWGIFPRSQRLETFEVGCMYGPPLISTAVLVQKQLLACMNWEEVSWYACDYRFSYSEVTGKKTKLSICLIPSLN